MNIIIEHLFIFFQISLMCLFLSLSGFLFKRLLLNNYDTKNFEENGFFGFILISFLALFINFLFPLNLFINNIFFILIIYSGFKFKFFDQSIPKLFKYIFFSSIICYILFIYSNVNTPDAILYHLPYSKIINEHKIIIGLTNIHPRFGHISIFQYISSFFNNSVFNTNGLLIPLGCLVSFFFIFSFNLFVKSFKDLNTRIKSYFIFLILIFSFYSFNRYSGYGNDAQVHIYYFLTIIYLLDVFLVKDSVLNFKKLSLVCLFTFLIKPFYIIAFILPFAIYIIKDNKLILLKSKFFVFSFSFIFLWFVKNFLVSGCLIYPVNATCSDKVLWYDHNNTEIISISGEAWSKAWPDRKIKNINQKEFNKKFNWLTSWAQSHLLIIIEKLLPMIIFIVANILFFYFTKCLKKNKPDPNFKFYLLIFLVNFVAVILWFLKFPIYRYGLSFIYTLLIFSLYFIYIKYIDLKKIEKFYKVFISIIMLIFIGIIIKNVDRFLDDRSQSLTPSLFDKRINSESIKIYNKDNIFTHFIKKDGGLCGYSVSPCHQIKLNIGKKIILGYKIYYTY